LARNKNYQIIKHLFSPPFHRTALYAKISPPFIRAIRKSHSDIRVFVVVNLPNALDFIRVLTLAIGAGIRGFFLSSTLNFIIYPGRSQPNSSLFFNLLSPPSTLCQKEKTNILPK
jgi:hypothetical protein